MKNFINYSLFFFLISSVAFSQVINFEEKGYIPIMPQTPNVASMQKFQETSVSKYTGLPSINVPIFTIDLKELQIPIFLDYHSAGIRVNETASWVGQNWNLVAGGSVVRTVKHLADDMPNYGYINNPITAPIIHEECISDPLGGTCITYLNQMVLNNQIDFEPDLFSYNAPGISGKFMFDQNRSFPDHPKGRVISIPKTENKIIPYFSGPNSNGQEINSFFIYDNKGNKFDFEIGNELLLSDSHTVTETNLPEERIKPFTTTYVQTWNLTKITTYLGEIVNFNYTTENYTECSFSSQKRIIYSSNQDQSLLTTYSSTSGTTTYLSSITGDFGSISFTGVNNREDHDGKSLSEIIISNNTEVIKRVEFNYSYTQSNLPGYTIYGCSNSGTGILYDHQQTPGNNNAAYIKYTKRMFLDSLKIKDLNVSNGEDSYFYFFEYNNELPLPHRNSYAQDFWGYYNGQNNSSICLNVADYMGYNDPNRHISPSHSKLGLLKKIVFPEGGYSVFDYEINKGLTEIGSLLFRKVPFEIKEIEINTNDTFPIPEYSVDDITSEHVFTYKKPILINNRNFPLINNSHFTYSSFTTSDCVYDSNSLPLAGACSLWMNIKKTDIDHSQFYDVSEINLNSINYNIDNSYNFNTLLNGGYGGSLIIDGAGVYILELEVRTPINPSPQPGNTTLEFDFNQHMASLKLKYKLAHPSVKFHLVHNGQSVYVEIPIGGQRIKSIKTYGNDNVLALNKTYTYTLEGQNVSSGKSLSIPYFLANDQYSVYELSYCPVPLVTTSSNHIGYTRVVEKRFNGMYHTNTNSIIDEFSFYDIRMNTEYIHQYAPFIEDWRNGQNYRNEIPGKVINLFGYDDNWQEIVETDYTSHYFGMISPITERAHRFTFLTYIQFNQPGGGGIGGPYQGNNTYRLQYGYPTLMSKVEEQLFDNNSVVKTTLYEYDNPNLLSPTSIKVNTSNVNKNYLNKVYYPHDLLNVEPYMQSLISVNRIAQPVIKEVFIEEGGTETLLSTNKTLFGPGNANVLPNYIQTAKNNDPLETRLTIDSYDSKGNVLQVSLTNGPKTSYIYGYNNQYPVAKIENKAYNDIPYGLINAIHTASTSGTEAQLKTALDDLRFHSSMENAMVTTYIYKPLVGVTSITGPNGDLVEYNYDEFSRLESIKDKDGNLMQEYEYNYGNN